ncbi:hypothetical protein CDEST_00275 [Colletotrichum destructivum]|uniref:Uncharacterized protein n=1 Tax=Colletotrichum destructivum TaxID=34406 RepID=A0AAX4HVS3_9PEZI|nr:hypothetical protein CDEST_00275 [Colletotrichum destructivum]
MLSQTALRLVKPSSIRTTYCSQSIESNHILARDPPLRSCATAAPPRPRCPSSPMENPASRPNIQSLGAPRRTKQHLTEAIVEMVDSPASQDHQNAALGDESFTNVCCHGFNAYNHLITFATGGQFLFQMVKNSRTKDDCCALGCE